MHNSILPLSTHSNTDVDFTQQNNHCWLKTSPSTANSPTVSSFKTTTYHYSPKSNTLRLQPAFDRITTSTMRPSEYRPSTPELGHYQSPAASPNVSPLPKPARMAKSVQFGWNESARDASEAENDVMRSFHKHVRNCNTCYDNLSTWRSLGAPLCSTGHNKVNDMAPYFFCKDGKPFSLIDRDNDKGYIRVLVPDEHRYVGRLFEALNEGYSTSTSRQLPRRRSERPPVVHQTPRESRRPTTPIQEPERPTLTIPTKRYTSDRLSPRSAETYREEKRYHEPKSRGSLYHEDQRRRHRHREDVVYPSSPRSPRYHS